MQPCGSVQNGVPVEVIRCRLTDRTVFAIVEDATGTLVCSHFNEVDPKTSAIGDANMIDANTDTAEATQTCVGQRTVRQRRDKVGLTAEQCQ